jgi:hypothetical protein
VTAGPLPPSRARAARAAPQRGAAAGARPQREDCEVLPVNENRSLAPEHLKRRLVKTIDSNHRAVTFTIAEINIGKTARRDLVLKLEILSDRFLTSRALLQ